MTERKLIDKHQPDKWPHFFTEEEETKMDITCQSFLALATRKRIKEQPLDITLIRPNRTNQEMKLVAKYSTSVNQCLMISSLSVIKPTQPPRSLFSGMDGGSTLKYIQQLMVMVW